MPEDQVRWIRLCAWSVVAYLVLFGIFWGVLGHNIPPYSAAYPLEDLVAHYQANTWKLRIGYSVAMAAAVLYMTWTVGVFGIMRQMEQRGYMLSYLQLMGGSLTCLVVMFSCVFWLAAAFRPETDPNIIQLLHDLGWLMIDLGFSVTTVQYVAFGLLALADARPRPLFPKWVAWLGIWAGLESFVECIMPLFRTGPFAWNGLFPYWVTFFMAFTWMGFMAFYMLKAVSRLRNEGAAHASA